MSQLKTLPLNNEEILNTFDKIKTFVTESKNSDYSNEIKLAFYKYYKQALYGDCYLPQPWFYDQLNRAKWDAWESVKGTSKLDAMMYYIDLYNTHKKNTEDEDDNGA